MEFHFTFYQQAALQLINKSRTLGGLGTFSLHHISIDNHRLMTRELLSIRDLLAGMAKGFHCNTTSGTIFPDNFT